MSVGAGSIKRAAKAAEGNAEGNVEAKAGVGENGAAAKAARTARTTKTTTKTTKASKTAKTSENVMEEGKAAVENKAAKKLETGTTPYVTYGVGQELPVYLM